MQSKSNLAANINHKRKTKKQFSNKYLDTFGCDPTRFQCVNGLPNQYRSLKTSLCHATNARVSELKKQDGNTAPDVLDQPLFVSVHDPHGMCCPRGKGKSFQCVSNTKAADKTAWQGATDTCPNTVPVNTAPDTNWGAPLTEALWKVPVTDTIGVAGDGTGKDKFSKCIALSKVATKNNTTQKTNCSDCRSKTGEQKALIAMRSKLQTEGLGHATPKDFRFVLNLTPSSCQSDQAQFKMSLDFEIKQRESNFLPNRYGVSFTCMQDTEDQWEPRFGIEKQIEEEYGTKSKPLIKKEQDSEESENEESESEEEYQGEGQRNKSSEEEESNEDDSADDN